MSQPLQIICPRCGRGNNEAHIYCWVCGTMLADARNMGLQEIKSAGAAHDISQASTTGQTGGATAAISGVFIALGSFLGGILIGFILLCSFLAALIVGIFETCSEIFAGQ